MSRELRKALIEFRDKRLLEVCLKRKNDISDELVFRSPERVILDPDNLYHRVFLPVLAKAGIRRIRLHDLRHTFGSLLLQNGTSIVYVKGQMGHSSMQVTVDLYGHLIPRRPRPLRKIGSTGFRPKKRKQVRDNRNSCDCRARRKSWDPCWRERTHGASWTDERVYDRAQNPRKCVISAF